jgi:hypothetical protein
MASAIQLCRRWGFCQIPSSLLHTMSLNFKFWAEPFKAIGFSSRERLCCSFAMLRIKTSPQRWNSSGKLEPLCVLHCHPEAACIRLRAVRPGRPLKRLPPCVDSTLGSRSIEGSAVAPVTDIRTFCFRRGLMTGPSDPPD